MSQNKKADDLINMSSEENIFNVFYFYGSYTYTLTGTPIKYTSGGKSLPVVVEKPSASPVKIPDVNPKK